MKLDTSGSDVHCILLIIYQYNFLCPKLSEFTHYLMVSESYSGIMEAFAKKKGKVGTRGAGQIIKENDESLIFYRFLFCTTLFAWWSILIFQIIRVICGLSGTWYLAPMAFTSWPWPSWAEVMQPLTLPCSSSVPSVILDAFSSWGENVPLLLKIPNWLSILNSSMAPVWIEKFASYH